MNAMILRRMAAGLILALVCGGWAVGAQAQSATVVENVYLENGVRKVDTKLKVQTSTDRTRVTYLKVTVANAGTLKSAKLRLRCDGDGGSGVTRVYQGSHTNWTAATIAASNAPAALTPQITQKDTTYVIGQDYDFDLSSVITKDGTYTIIVKKDELGGDVAFSSTRGPVAPKVMIEVASTTPPADDTVPNINQFTVVPEAGASAAMINYSVAASSGSTLKEIQVWRAPDAGGVPGDWKQLLNNSEDVSALNVAAYIGSTRDGISDTGYYWYKIVVVDKAGKTAEAAPVKIRPADEPGTIPDDPVVPPDDPYVPPPVVDTTVPQISAFAVVPEAGASAAIISYDVSASSGSTLQEVQVWRAPDAGGVPGDWRQLLNNSVDVSALNVAAYIGSTRDGISDTGYYWYKIVVLDKAGKTAEADPVKIRPADEPGTTIPICGQNGCEAGETCSSCPADCGVCPVTPVCGQNGCEMGETCSSCPQDCGVCPVGTVSQLRPSVDHHYLVDPNGNPVFLMGDTAWTMPENCTREDVDYYLNDRKNRGFNYFQIVAARDLNAESLNTVDGRTMNPENQYGQRPFEWNADMKADVSRPIVKPGTDPSKPDDYWDHLEYILKKAQSMNMYVGILPTWGRYYVNTPYDTMRLFTPYTAKTYGRFLGSRYKNYSNVLWILGGDAESPIYPIDEVGDTGLAIYRGMAEGLVQGMTGSAPAWYQDDPAWDKILITLHYGGGSSYQYFNDDAWLKLDCSYPVGPKVYPMISAAYKNTPARPILVGESYYEDWVYDGTYQSPRIMRQQIYHAIMAGGIGAYTYGSAKSLQGAEDQLFKFQPGWKDRVDLDGTNDMRHVVNLLKNMGIRWWRLVPDQTILTAGVGSGELLKAAARSMDKDQLLVFFPNVSAGTVDLRKITTNSRVAATWYDPRRGITQAGGVFANTQPVSFTPPVDWMDAVLILKGTTAALQNPVIAARPEFKTINGEVVIAAENFTAKGGTGGLLGTWAIEQDKSGYLGAGYMRSSKDKPSDATHLVFNANLASLNYVIDFKETGTYYVHLRTLAMEHDENGFFATLDGKQINYGGINPATGLTASFIYVEKNGAWNWYTDGGGTEGRGLKVSFNITTPGKHTFTLYRRDTGSRVDHIWLTKTDSTPNNTATLNLPDPGLFVVK